MIFSKLKLYSKENRDEINEIVYMFAPCYVYAPGYLAFPTVIQHSGVWFAVLQLQLAPFASSTHTIGSQMKAVHDNLQSTMCPARLVESDFGIHEASDISVQWSFRYKKAQPCI